MKQELTTRFSGLKKKLDYIQNDYNDSTKSQQTNQDLGLSNLEAQHKLLDLTNNVDLDIDKLVNNLIKINDKQVENTTILFGQGEKIKNANDKQDDMEMQVKKADQAERAMERAAFMKKLSIRVIAGLMTITNVILVIKIFV